eukprot:CAMPEP_0182495762 /NCGR_PEP_ID=MMETSP1321-20130603/4508_1 /TAXON_ID=91990 /ORGANISM="Bolidomonas sp., Strain RCC1657" /LENGTH=44 /DNA_ID= /DNA_START= /DNA_END= /DNA_ORIENTATION=
MSPVIMASILLKIASLIRTFARLWLTTSMTDDVAIACGMPFSWK